MATRTISTRLAIEGEAEYKRAIQSCNSELSTLKSALALTESEFKGNANSMEALSAKGDALTASWEKQRDKVATLEAALQNAQAAQQAYADRVATAQENIQRCEQALEELKNTTGDTSKEQEALTAELEGWSAELQEAERYQESAERGVNSWQKQLNLAKVDLNTLSGELEQNGQYMEEAKNSADGCATSIDRFGKGVSDAGTAVDALSAALVAAGVAKAIGEISDALLACAASAQTYETAMAKLSTLADTSVVSMDTLGAELTRLSGEMGTSATALAEAAYQALSASVDTADVIEFVTQATMLSKAGFTEAATAVDVLTTALNAYGMAGSEVEVVASMLVKTQDLGKTSVDELAASMGRVIPSAAALGVGLDNLSASYAILTKNGINTRIATTNLNAMFNELADDSKRVARILEDTTGKTFTELMESGWSLSDVLDVLSDSVQGNSTEFKNMWSQSTASAAALTIFNAGAEEFNQTLEEMQNSSGMAARNFEIMADTTEFSQQRMEAAAENLRNAVGGQLNPVLEKLYELGARAFGWAADFVEEHPGVVQGLAAVTGAVSALMLAFAGYTVISKASGAFFKFTAALAAHPMGAAALAVGTLVTALGTLALFSNSAEEASAALASSIKETRQAFEELNEAIRQEERDTVLLVSALNAALSAEEKTEAQIQVILRLVDQLNETIPDLGLHYDELADSLNMTTEALQEQVQAAAETQSRAAMIDYFAELSVALETSNAGLAEATAHWDTLRSRMQDGESISDGMIGTAQAEIVRFTEQTRELEAQLAVLTLALEGMPGTAEVFGGGTAEMEQHIDSLIEELDALEQEYHDALNEAYDNINKVIGGWKEMDNTLKTSAETLNNALLSQIEYMENYSDNMQHLIDRDIDGVEVLAQRFSDGSEESAAALAGLTDASDEEIREIIENLTRVEEGKDYFVDSMIELTTDFDERMAELEERLRETVDEMDVSDEAYIIGQDNIQGLIDGAESKRQELINTYRSMAQEAVRAYKAEMRQMSPSKAMREVGSFDIEGLIIGAQSREQELVETYRSLAASALQAMECATPSVIIEPPRAAQTEQQTAAIMQAITRTRGGGDTYNFYSPEALDEKSAAREFRRAQRDLALGIS